MTTRMSKETKKVAQSLSSKTDVFRDKIWGRNNASITKEALGIEIVDLVHTLSRDRALCGQKLSSLVTLISTSFPMDVFLYEAIKLIFMLRLGKRHFQYKLTEVGSDDIYLYIDMHAAIVEVNVSTDSYLPRMRDIRTQLTFYLAQSRSVMFSVMATLVDFYRPGQPILTPCLVVPQDVKNHIKQMKVTQKDFHDLLSPLGLNLLLLDETKSCMTAK